MIMRSGIEKLVVIYSQENHLYMGNRQNKKQFVFWSIIIFTWVVTLGLPTLPPCTFIQPEILTENIIRIVL